jgi:uncharacterized protein YeeX (DUF496 family)
MHLEILKNNTSKVWNEIKSFDGLDNLETFFKRPLQVLVKSNNELIFLIRQFFEKQVSDYTKNNI